MKKDPFKDFIQEHQDEFNTLEPSQNVWKGIEDSSKKERRLYDSRVLLRVAASLFFILGAAWIALQIVKMPTTEVADKEEVKTEELYDYAFSGISDELAEVEHYYVNEVAQKQALLSNFKVDEDLMEEVQLLNEEFEQLKIEMGQSADPMRVVEAMINNYQLRLEILQSILDQLESEKEKVLQNGKESYV